jgi:hypothetical protein
MFPATRGRSRRTGQTFRWHFIVGQLLDRPTIFLVLLDAVPKSTLHYKRLLQKILSVSNHIFYV